MTQSFKHPEEYSRKMSEMYDVPSGCSYLATITNYYRRHGFEFDCNQEATLVRGAKPLIDFN